MVKNPSANAGEARNLGSIPESGRFPGVGIGNPLQYPCLENSMDRVTGGLQSMGSSEQMTFSLFLFDSPRLLVEACSGFPLGPSWASGNWGRRFPVSPQLVQSINRGAAT